MSALAMSELVEAPVLVVADESLPARVFLADNLCADGYTVFTAEDRHQALQHVSAHAPDAVIIDVNGETLRVIDVVRDRVTAVSHRLDRRVPILVLTSDSQEIHRVRLLERGADDVMLKPFSYPELRARVGALIRRARMASEEREVLHAAGLRIDPHTLEVLVEETGERVALTHKERRLLMELARDPMRVVTRQELVSRVWGNGYGQSRTLDSHVVRLRRKLREATGGDFVANVWGVGYRLLAPNPTGTAEEAAAGRAGRDPEME